MGVAIYIKHKFITGSNDISQIDPKRGALSLVILWL